MYLVPTVPSSIAQRKTHVCRRHILLRSLPGTLQSAMRIGVDIRCLMDGKRTGVEEYTLGVLQAMVSASPADQFVLFANSVAPMRLPSFDAPHVEVRAFAYPNTLFNMSLKVAHIPKLDRLLGGVDVFFVPSFRLAPLSRRCPLVLTVHDLSFVRHPHFFSRDRRTWHRIMDPLSLTRSAEHILAVSQATAHDVEALYGVPGSHISVIPSGISSAMRPLPNGSPVREAVRMRYRLPERFILFLGTLEPRKNLESLLEAYASARSRGVAHALVLAGTRGWMPRTFFSRIREHPYARNILLTGFIEDADKPAVYSMADLFVYPSFYEGFGFPPLEALACGTPVVTSFNSAIPEIVGDFGALLTNPYDAEELAGVMIDRLQAPRPVPADVSTRIRDTYSWSRAGKETLRVLHEAGHSWDPNRIAERFYGVPHPHGL